MSETVTKRLTVTFNDGLPLGTHGSFSYGGQRWIALPVPKYQDIVGVTDRLIGVMARTRRELTNWLAAHPENAPRVVPILSILADAAELAHEKIKAQTR